jgi:hypothetical protein
MDTNQQDILQDPLSLDLDNEELSIRLRQKIKSYTTYIKDNNLEDKWIQNEKYLWGENILNKKYSEGDPKYLDNVIWESESTIKPIALSKTPDLIVYPGSDSEESRKNSEKLTRVVNHDLKRRVIRKVAGIAHRHLPIYLTSCVKAVWNPEKGKNGDYEFVNVHPRNLVFDTDALTNESEYMSFVMHKITDRTVRDITQMFPKKKKEIFSALGWMSGEENQNKYMDTKPTEFYEAWFVENKESKDGVKKVYGLAYMLKNQIIEKIKNPYFDYEGYDETFVYDPTTNQKRKATEQDLMSALIGFNPPTMASEKFYRNYFECPRIPFIFLGYEQWGDSPFDKTSRVMQNIPKQDNINLRGKQIAKINEKAIPKPVFSKQSGIQSSDVEKFLTDDDGVMFIDGKINETYATFGGQQAGQALTVEMQDDRERAFATAGTNATTRGQVETDTATVGQIARESDYGRIDDLKYETIDYLYSQMAQWSLHFIKLFYTKEHLRKILGIDGDLAFESITQDLVEDGVEVDIKASSVDKVKRESDAKEDAKLGLSDPLTYFEDLERPNPKERAKRVLLLKLNPELYLQQVLGGVNSQPTVQALNQMPTPPTSVNDQQPVVNTGFDPAPQAGV